MEALSEPERDDKEIKSSNESDSAQGTSSDERVKPDVAGEDATNAETNKARDELEAENRQLKARLARAQSDLKASRASESSLKARVTSTERQVDALTYELANSRAFVQADDAGDVDSVVAAFVQINEAIDDFVFGVAEAIEGTRGCDLALSEELVHSLRDARAPFNAPEIANLLYEQDGGSQVVDVLTPCLFTLVFRTMHDVIFANFKPAIEPNRYAHLRQIMLNIAENETQDKFGRWRALTYKHVDFATKESDEALARSITTTVSKQFDKLVSFAFEGSHARPRNIKWHLLDKILIKAIAWQHRVKTSYLSAEYEPFLTLDEHQVRGQDDDEPLAFYSMGLLSIQSVKGSSAGRIERKQEVLLEPQFRCARDFE